MANKKLTEVTAVSTINDADYLFVNQNQAIRQIKKSDIPKPTYTADEVGALPNTTTTLPNPNALTFTGAATGSYDGSSPIEINIPEGGGTGVTVDNTLSVAGEAADAKATGDAISSLSEEIANLSGGLNSTAKSLLITILRDGIYNTNQSANITALSVALENTGGDNTSVPTESISITGDTTVNFRESLILTATLTPSNTTDSVVWTSSNEKIATVTGSGSKNTVGTVTGIKGGTVTIRAIAGSISTTYTVTVVENVSLPDGYTALDYIVSNWKSSFDTGITADENTSAEYKISFKQVSAVHVLADNGAYAFPTSANGGSVRSKRGGTDYNYSYTLLTDTIYTIKAFAENSVNVNGININTKSVVGNTPSGNGTLIFNNYGSASSVYGSTAKYYYMKIWEGETLVRWYIPCKDVNGTVGMYDIVENTFNGSSGETFKEV